MGIKCGIVGLPNVGKSTFFNAICEKANAEAANYPFCTIEPNKAFVDVPDVRLQKISKIANSKKIIQSRIEFIDIAGLVKGASQGEGCGNKFLSHISEVDLIVHVVRCFDDSNISHVHGKIDPLSDIEVINNELILYDLVKLENKQNNITKKIKLSGNKSLQEEKQILDDLIDHLSKGLLVNQYSNFAVHFNYIKNLFLLTSKPVLYVCNIAEVDLENSGNEYTDGVKQAFKHNKVINICAKFENEIKVFEDEADRANFLTEAGIDRSGIDKVIYSAFLSLGLRAYFTVGINEARMWTIKNGSNAVDAARVIHSDFADGFIKAEVIAYEDYLKYGEQSREMGLMRMEGKEYIVLDGDIINFKFNKTT